MKTKKTIKCYAILGGFDKGREVFKQYKDKIYEFTKVDSYHHLVKWELDENEFELLYKAYGGSISNKVKIIE